MLISRFVRPTGNDLPWKLGDFPLALAGQPICDVDKYYDDKRTFIVVTQGKSIYRFSAGNALMCLSPFHPIRRCAILVLTNNWFSLAIILTILINCYVMVKPDTE